MRFLIEIPWIGIWIHPKLSVNRAFEIADMRHISLIACLHGIVIMYTTAMDDKLGNWFNESQLFLFIVFGGIAAGFIYLYLISWLLKLTGKIFLGKASPSRLRIAVSWGSIPFIWFGLILIVLHLMMGETLLAETAMRTAYSMDDIPPFWGGVLMGAIPVIVILFFFGPMIIGAKCIGQAQHFSTWLAAVTYAVAIFLMVTIVSIIGVPLAILFSF